MISNISEDGLRKRISMFSVYLTIGGKEIDFDECSLETGLQPDRLWRQKRQDLVDRSDLNAAEWSVGFEKQPFEDTDDALRFLLSRVWPVRDRIREYVSKRDLSAYINCTITISKERPLYRLRPKTIQQLAEIGYEVIYDIYDYRE